MQQTEFFQRAIIRFRAHDWVSAAIQLAIVFIGVFVGSQVSNWNQNRLQRHETDKLLVQMRPEVHYMLSVYANAKTYYGITRAYADIALRGWRGDPTTTDEQFVIAAYQASQVYTLASNGSAIALVFGADQFRNVDDPELRQRLSDVMTYDNTDLGSRAVATPYRQNARLLIPDDLQQAIRARCGDKSPPEAPFMFMLAKACTLNLPRRQAAQAARTLREHSELVGELNGHLAAEALFLEDLNVVQTLTRRLSERLDALK